MYHVKSSSSSLVFSRASICASASDSARAGELPTGYHLKLRKTTKGEPVPSLNLASNSFGNPTVFSSGEQSYCPIPCAGSHGAPCHKTPFCHRESSSRKPRALNSP